MSRKLAQVSKKSTTASQPTVAELREWYANNKNDLLNFAKGKDALKVLKDLNGKVINSSIPIFDKEMLRNYFSNLTSNESRFRDAARYLYYRSNVFFRIVNWYTSFWDLNCRKITPPYNLIKDNNDKKAMKSFEDTIDQLDLLNLKGNLIEAFLNVYTEDVYYGVRYTDKTGTIFIRLDQKDCKIDGKYMTGDFSYSVDMSAWRGTARQQLIKYLGEPFTSMWRTYEQTKQKWVHMPDEYAVCLKFDTKDIDISAPPLARIMLQLYALEDNIDVQAVADKLSIYKLIYMPLDTLTQAKNSDDWKISPELAAEYFNKLLDESLPDYVAGAMVPGKELKTIDFAQSADNDINRVENSIDNIFATAGGGAVLNVRNMNNTAMFNAWLLEEENFAMTTLLPQINGLANRLVSYDVKNPSVINHFKVSCYTKENMRKAFLESNQYSFFNRIAYNTLLGITEKETLSSIYLENQLLNLPEKMQYPLQSSYTISADSDSDIGRPKVDDDQLSDSGERSRNQ